MHPHTPKFVLQCGSALVQRDVFVDEHVRHSPTSAPGAEPAFWHAGEATLGHE
jgi:hypothetical protein